MHVVGQAAEVVGDVLRHQLAREAEHREGEALSTGNPFGFFHCITARKRA